MKRKKIIVFLILLSIAFIIGVCSIFIYNKNDNSVEKNIEDSNENNEVISNQNINSNNKLHTIDEIENEVKKYSFNFTRTSTDGGTVSLDGYIETEIDVYFHDNDLNFDFYAKSEYSPNSDNGKQMYVGYWDPYLKKLEESIGKEISDYLKNKFSKYLNIETIQFEFDRSVSIWDITLPGNDKFDLKFFETDEGDKYVMEAYRGIINIIKSYDSKFMERKKIVDTWFNEDDKFRIRLNARGLSFGMYDVESDEKEPTRPW